MGEINKEAIDAERKESYLQRCRYEVEDYDKKLQDGTFIHEHTPINVKKRYVVGCFREGEQLIKTSTLFNAICEMIAHGGNKYDIIEDLCKHVENVNEVMRDILQKHDSKRNE